MKSNHTVRFLPTLSVRNCSAAISFYKKAFGTQELMRQESPDGDVVAELAIGDCHFIVADESPQHGNFSPATLGGTTIRMGLEVHNPDEVFTQAINGGATEIYQVADQSYGYRLGRLSDPYGHHWEIFKKL
jgi:PhnB protein